MLSKTVFLTTLTAAVAASSSSASTCATTPTYLSAQAYVPNSPTLSSTDGLCTGDYDLTVSGSAMSVTRSYVKTRKLDFTVTVRDASCSAAKGATVEVWHTSPTGSYSPLSAPDESECRGTLTTGTTGMTSINSFVPGSYGALNGLGPANIDFSPWGPPLVSLLVSADGFDPVQTSFYIPEESGYVGSDYRGLSFVGGERGGMVEFENAKYTADKVSGSITITLSPSDESDERSSGDKKRDLLCPNAWYGGVTGFFTESVVVCRPELMEFFRL
jgi:protocatechuate 3,4-dioxygenase beta subunit